MFVWGYCWTWWKITNSTSTGEKWGIWNLVLPDMKWDIVPTPGKVTSAIESIGEISLCTYFLFPAHAPLKRIQITTSHGDYGCNRRMGFSTCGTYSTWFRSSEVPKPTLTHEIEKSQNSTLRRLLWHWYLMYYYISIYTLLCMHITLYIQPFPCLFDLIWSCLMLAGFPSPLAHFVFLKCKVYTSLSEGKHRNWHQTQQETCSHGNIFQLFWTFFNI